MRLPGAVRVIHPFPTLMNVVTTGALALIALRGRQAPLAVLQLMLAMFAIQASIGIVNDLLDRDRDRASGRAKPLVDGEFSVLSARVAATICLIVAVVLSAGFGIAAWLLAMAGLACGLTYDLWLKRTWASPLPYLVALPLLPLWVWVALGRFRPALLALIPLACLIGLALHLANALTDFDADALTGDSGLVQRLGRRRAIALCWGSFGLALLLALASGRVVAHESRILLPGLGLAAATLVLTIATYLLRPSQRSLRCGWDLLVLGSAVLALGWLAALPG
jgi:4-hydroxybenzoate polyprenyltransferase